MINELLPCPFCGEDPEWTSEWREDRNSADYYIVCGDCNAVGPERVMTTKEQSINDWNTRHSPITPPRGEPMPQTQEYWEKRAIMDQDLILEQREDISKLKVRINKLEQGNKQIKSVDS